MYISGTTAHKMLWLLHAYYEIAPACQPAYYRNHFPESLRVLLRSAFFSVMPSFGVTNLYARDIKQDVIIICNKI